MLSWLLLFAFAAAPEAPPLVVSVSPPLDPAGAPWVVQLFEESPEGRKPVDERPVDADGRWTTSEVRGGRRYRLRVATSAGAGWFADERAFEWSEETWSAGTRELRLGSSALRGTVLLGKKRLGSRVTFTDRDGLVSVPFRTKEDGTFEGVLPRDGWWSVTVASDRPHFVATFDVKVDPVFRDGTPPDVELRVVSKEIRGEIVDAKNAPVPSSSLHVFGFQEPLKTGDGRFTWDRVSDGWMTIHASAPAGPGRVDFSPTKSIRVSGGWVEPGFVSLPIKPTYVLRVRALLATGEPAVGAFVHLVSSFVESRRTPGDGRVQMTVRGGGDRACLLVVNPSKEARLASAPASRVEQDVAVADASGTLSLEIKPRGDRTIGTVVSEGCRLPWGFLRWIPGALPGGNTFSTTASFRASAGSYAFCALERGELDDDAEIPREECVTGVLAPGGTLKLRLDP